MPMIRFVIDSKVFKRQLSINDIHKLIYDFGNYHIFVSILCYLKIFLLVSKNF